MLPVLVRVLFRLTPLCSIPLTYLSNIYSTAAEARKAYLKQQKYQAQHKKIEDEIDELEEQSSEGIRGKIAQLELKLDKLRKELEKAESASDIDGKKRDLQDKLVMVERKIKVCCDASTESQKKYQEYIEELNK